MLNNRTLGLLAGAIAIVLIATLVMISQKPNVVSLKLVNVTESSATLAFVTSRPEKVVAFASESDNIGMFGNKMKYYDVRDMEEETLKSNTPRFTHFIKLADLKPETTYYYGLKSNGGVYKEKGYSFTTPSVQENITTPDIVYGIVKQGDEAMVTDGVVVLTKISKDQTSQAVGGIITSNGSYSVDVSGLLQEDMKTDFTSLDADILESIEVWGVVGKEVKKVKIVAEADKDQPVDNIRLDKGEKLAMADSNLMQEVRAGVDDGFQNGREDTKPSAAVSVGQFPYNSTYSDACEDEIGEGEENVVIFPDILPADETECQAIVTFMKVNKVTEFGFSKQSQPINDAVYNYYFKCVGDSKSYYFQFSINETNPFTGSSGLMAEASKTCLKPFANSQVQYALQNCYPEDTSSEIIFWSPNSDGGLPTECYAYSERKLKDALLEHGIKSLAHADNQPTTAVSYNFICEGTDEVRGYRQTGFNTADGYLLLPAEDKKRIVQEAIVAIGNLCAGGLPSVVNSRGNIDEVENDSTAPPTTSGAETEDNCEEIPNPQEQAACIASSQSETEVTENSNVTAEIWQTYFIPCGVGDTPWLKQNTQEKQPIGFYVSALSESEAQAIGNTICEAVYNDDNTLFSPNDGTWVSQYVKEGFYAGESRIQYFLHIRCQDKDGNELYEYKEDVGLIHNDAESQNIISTIEIQKANCDPYLEEWTPQPVESSKTETIQMSNSPDSDDPTKCTLELPSGPIILSGGNIPTSLKDDPLFIEYFQSKNHVQTILDQINESYENSESTETDPMYSIYGFNYTDIPDYVVFKYCDSDGYLQNLGQVMVGITNDSKSISTVLTLTSSKTNNFGTCINDCKTKGAEYLSTDLQNIGINYAPADIIVDQETSTCVVNDFVGGIEGGTLNYYIQCPDGIDNIFPNENGVDLKDPDNEILMTNAFEVKLQVGLVSKLNLYYEQCSVSCSQPCNIVWRKYDSQNGLMQFTNSTSTEQNAPKIEFACYLETEVTSNTGENLRENLFTSAKAQNTQTLDAGIYEITGTNISNKNYTVDSESQIKFFYDLNNNGLFDPGETILTDEEAQNVQVTIKKVSDIQSYNLNQGWNLVSIPMLIDGEGSSGVKKASQLVEELNTQGADVTHVVTYRDGDFVVFSRRTDNKGDIKTYGNDFTILPGEAYFLKNYKDATVTLKGNKVEGALDVLVNPGWNLVSVYNESKDSYTGFEVLDQMNEQGVDAEVLSKWDGLYTNIVSKGGVKYGNDFTVLPTSGYWVQNTGEAKKTYTPK